jgi:succinate dehydrogenase / fumarate reductase membrane anchor subunit
MTDRSTPMARVLGYGSAKEGTGHWWTQRVSSVGVLILGIWFLVAIARLPGLGHADLTEWLGSPVNAVLMLLLVMSVARHSDLGIQVIIEDYVHQPFAKVAAIVVSRFLHALLAAASVFAILSTAFR